MGLGQKIVLIMALFVLGLFVFSLVGYGLSSLIFGLEIQDLGDYENYQSITQAISFFVCYDNSIVTIQKIRDL